MANNEQLLEKINIHVRRNGNYENLFTASDVDKLKKYNIGGLHSASYVLIEPDDKADWFGEDIPSSIIMLAILRMKSNLWAEEKICEARMYNYIRQNLKQFDVM